MSSAKTVFVLLALLGASRASWVIMDSEPNLFKTFQQSMRDLEVASRRVGDLMASQTKLEAQGTREELEDDADKPDDVDPDTVGKDEDEDDGTDLSSVLGGIPDFFKIFKYPSSQPWWSGANVCVSRETKEDKPNKDDDNQGERDDGIFIVGTAQFSSCKHTTQKYVCTTVTRTNGLTKTSTVIYQCCHGFSRTGDSTGCSKVETKPILEMAADLGVSKFSSIVASLGMEEKLEGKNKTVIMPTDEAFKEYQEVSNVNQVESQNQETNDVNEIVTNGNTLSKDTILNHLLPAIYQTSDFHNDMLLKTEGNSTLRINIYPGRNDPKITVNCAHFNVTDKMSDSGIVHTVNRVLEPVKSTILEILGAPQYSQFTGLLEEAGLLKELEGEGPFTVFALTNEAMNNMQSKTMCMKKVLKHHILPHMVCSEAVSEGRISVMDSSLNWAQLSTDESGLYLDRTVKVEKRDILATNGVVHQVKTLAVPSSAKSLREILQMNNRTEFLRLLQQTGVLAEVENSKDKVTLFVPTEGSLKEAAADLASLDSDSLRDLVAYHVGVDPETEEGCELKNGVMVMDTKAEGKKLTIRGYSKISQILAGLNQVTTVGCAKLTGAKAKVCNGAVREVAGVIRPPNGTLYDLIQNREDLRAFRDLLAGTKLEEKLKAGFDKSVTLLVPTGEALKKMGDGNYETLIKDKPLADQILRAHVLTEPVCCSSVGYSSWPFAANLRSLSGGTVEADRRGEERVVFGGVPAHKCDILASDGIVHILSGVLLPAGQRRNTDIIFRKPNSEIILTGF